MLTFISFTRVGAVARRALQQLQHDRRFLVLSLVAPILIIYMFKLFFASLPSSPMLNIVDYILPVGAFIVHFLTYILCAIVLVRERTAQTLTRMFVNGYRRGEIVLGYLVAYSVLATLQSLLVILSLRWLFSLDYAWSTMFSIYLVIWTLALISIALGIFISNFARNEGQVFPFIPLIIFPSIFFSGLLVSFERLPTWAQWAGHLTPLYYAVNLLRKLASPGGTLLNDQVSLASLPIYAIIVLCLAMITLRERD